MNIKDIQNEATRLWAAANNTSAANARFASADEMAPFFAEVRSRLIAN